MEAVDPDTVSRPRRKLEKLSGNFASWENQEICANFSVNSERRLPAALKLTCEPSCGVRERAGECGS